MRQLPNGLVLPRGVDPEDLESRVLQPQTRGIWYVCPVCKNRAYNNLAGMEPCCTGPNASLDEHPMEVMVREPE